MSNTGIPEFLDTMTSAAPLILFVTFTVCASVWLAASLIQWLSLHGIYV